MRQDLTGMFTKTKQSLPRGRSGAVQEERAQQQFLGCVCVVCVCVCNTQSILLFDSQEGQRMKMHIYRYFEKVSQRFNIRTPRKTSKSPSPPQKLLPRILLIQQAQAQHDAACQVITGIPTSQIRVLVWSPCSPPRIRSLFLLLWYLERWQMRTKCLGPCHSHETLMEFLAPGSSLLRPQEFQLVRSKPAVKD